MFKKGISAWNKGIPWSAEVKQKLSNSHKGLVSPRKGVRLSKEVRDRMSKAQLNSYLHGRVHPRGMLGKTVSEATKKKLSESHKGMIFSEEHKKNLSLSKQGEKNYRWNPDREALKRNQRSDPEYKQWVRKIKDRDNNVCQLKDENCQGYMVAAHIKGWALYPEERYNVNNGIILCQGHHPKTRSEDQRLMPVFQELVESSN